MSTKKCTNDEKEKIIEEVRKYPELFDKAHSDYKDKQVADNIWQKIAATTGIEDAEKVKKTWKNLIDTRRVYIKSERSQSGQAAKKLRKWHFKEQMDFLNSFSHDATTVSNIPPNDSLLEGDDESDASGIDGCSLGTQDTQDTQDDEDSQSVGPSSTAPPEPEVQSPTLSTTPKGRPMPGKARRRKMDPVDDELLKYLHGKRQKTNEQPALCADQMFLNSLLPNLKELSEERKMMTKIKIMQILHEAKYMSHSPQYSSNGSVPQASTAPYTTTQATNYTNPLQTNMSYLNSITDNTDYMNL